MIFSVFKNLTTKSSSRPSNHERKSTSNAFKDYKSISEKDLLENPTTSQSSLKAEVIDLSQTFAADESCMLRPTVSSPAT